MRADEGEGAFASFALTFRGECKNSITCTLHDTSAATLVNPPVSDNSCGEAAARPLTPLGYNWGEQKAKINKSVNTNARKREIQMQESKK